jgi:Uncharacterized protein conserved in bacteria (DUF2059)
VRSTALGAILCLLGVGLVGCSGHIKPPPRAIRLATAPSIESIGEFLDLIEVDDLVDRLVTAEKSLFQDKITQSRENPRLTAAQANLCDELIGKAMSVIDETFSPERMRGIFITTIQRSFTQRDIDALIVFYRTQSGKAIVAELKRAIRPYVEQQKSRTELIGSDSEHDREIQPGAILHVFSEAAESHQLSQFYGDDIDQDITSRLPNARDTYQGEIEPLAAELLFRLRELVADYKAKYRALATR